MHIRIKSTPPGEAPEHIRQAWVGLVLPVPGRIRRRGGFAEVPRDVLARRFWQFLRFLQQHNLTSRIVARGLNDITEQTVLRNRYLNDAGFYFIQKYHGRWASRTHKDRGEEKEETFLEKWYETFQKPAD